MISTFKDCLNEISSNPVSIEWYYKKEGDWFGTFRIDNVEYDINFNNEGREFPKNIGSVKFSRPDLDNPHSFSKDFNKPLVVANTVKLALKEYIKKIDVFIIKSYAKEQSRVKKYRLLAKDMMFGTFSYFNEITHNDYVCFILYKNSKAFKNNDIEDFIKTHKLNN